MVGKFAGMVNIASSAAELSINIPELYWGSRMMSVTLQDHIFPVA